MEIKIRNFRDLLVWKEGHALVITIYKLSENFPQKETFSLTNQMRRCAVSVTSNIAEGFSRQGKKEKLQFYYTSRGSLTELENQLEIARDVGYVNHQSYTTTIEKIGHVGRLLTGLIQSLRKRD